MAIPKGFSKKDIKERTVLKSEAQAMAAKLSDRMSYRIVKEEKGDNNYALYAKPKTARKKTTTGTRKKKTGTASKKKATRTKSKTKKTSSATKPKSRRKPTTKTKTSRSRRSGGDATWLDRALGFVE